MEGLGVEEIGEYDMKHILDAYRGKRVLVTGHTGFKGSWMCLLLQMAGAKVTGYALEPEISPSLFRLANIDSDMKSVIGDIRDLKKLNKVFLECQPEYIFHLAAQPIVRESYRRPVETYSTNVMGTVNLLECVRNYKDVCSILNVTTDKVYLNCETERGYVEDDKLDGYDPYSNSKSCSELVTHSYYKSFLKDMEVRVSTARAGNVIGGGDFEKDRLIPDCVRAALAGEPIIIRNPDAIRPFQHVLEPLFVYLMIAKRQTEDATIEGAYNVGPEEKDCQTASQLADCFCKKWGNDMGWICQEQDGPHEAEILKLDCKKLRYKLGWKAKWDIDIAMDKIVEWTKVYQHHGDIKKCMQGQIMEYLG